MPARYASISASRSWAVTLFFVKRAGPFRVFFLFVGTAFGLVTTSAGGAGAFWVRCFGALALKNEWGYAVNMNGTRAYALTEEKALTGRGLSLARCSFFLVGTSVVATEMVALSWQRAFQKKRLHPYSR